MKNKWLLFPFILLFSMMSVAFSQTLVEGIPGVDLVAWGASVLMYGYAVMLFTEALKTRITNRGINPPGTMYTIAAYAIAIGGAYGIYSSGNLTDPVFFGLLPPLNWILFGIIAGAISTGWYDSNKEKKSGSKLLEPPA